MVVCAEGLGVHRGSRMFRYMLNAISFVREENVAAKVEYLKKTLRWSDAEVRIAVCKAPTLLARSKDMLQCRSAFFFSEVGLEPTYIAHQPSLLSYSLEGRLKPRYYVVRFLKENGFVKHDPSYCTVVKLTEKEFVKKFICPHMEVAPHLSEDYAAACRGEVPANFKFV
jgi:mTERF domain-containing protein